MIKLYTSDRYFKKDGVMFIDAFFDTNVTRDMLGKKEEEYLKKYENAVFIDDDILKGKFGAFTLNNISSGMKTLLVVSLMETGKINNKEYINITECGSNLINEVLDLIEKMQVPCILNHSSLYGCKDREFVVDNKVKVNTIDNLIDLINERIGN